MPHESSAGRKFWRNGLKTATACPFCDYKFKKIEARVIEEAEDSELFYFSCQKCGHAILNLIFSHQMGIGSMSLVTDLAFEEVLRFHKSKPISLDDVLETHLWLDSTEYQKLFKN